MQELRIEQDELGVIYVIENNNDGDTQLGTFPDKASALSFVETKVASQKRTTLARYLERTDLIEDIAPAKLISLA